jgi:hypothetical protein
MSAPPVRLVLSSTTSVAGGEALSYNQLAAAPSASLPPSGTFGGDAPRRTLGPCMRPWKSTRTPAHVCLPEGHRDGVRHSAGRPQTCPPGRTAGRCGGRCQGVLGLRLTRLPYGKVGVPCPPECARMRGPKPEPPASLPLLSSASCKDAARSRGPSGLSRAGPHESSS